VLYTLCRLIEVGVVGLLGFGVVDLEFDLEFGVVGLLDRDPVRRRENRRGETDLFSGSPSKITSASSYGD